MTRRRRLLALSRHDQTPRQLLLELNPAASDYIVVADNHEDGFEANWEVLSMIFEDAPQKLTREDILGEWPADYDKPSASVLRKWLERALRAGLVALEGSGRKADPFRYWFPATEERWKQHILYDVIEQHTKNLKLPFQSLTEKKRMARQDERFRSSWDAGADDDDETPRVWGPP